MIGFIIPGELPTTNEIIDLSKKHYMQYSEMKRTYTGLVSMIARRLPNVKKADFQITWHCKDKRKDKDNIMGGQKFIFDGLVHAGVIKNDGWSQIGDVDHRFKVDKGNPRIEVLLLNVE
ncbi:RusA family crossover junction endodeoxyribonuclease [Lentibacillus sp. N15]|uniref:RusA family crossover junction endodeoxyribonuclease n=1 Tax=Lentibacillus songyuanensis TaxID=3136161 RepID=UPI0031BB1000